MRTPLTAVLGQRRRMPAGRKATTVLTFHGPFAFTQGENYLFNTGFLKSEGLYIWTIKDEVDKINYVHYIGETACFGRRQRQHLIQITGLNYRILDADFARQGLQKVVWNGLAGNKRRHAVADLLENYNGVSKKVVNYVGLLNVYFAPTAFELRLRRHVENCIGWNFRTKYPELQKFYPEASHAYAKTQRLGQKLILNLPEDIAGLDLELTI